MNNKNIRLGVAALLISSGGHALAAVELPASDVIGSAVIDENRTDAFVSMSTHISQE